MTELEKYQKVNACESIKDLQDCILSFADEEGLIQGRTQKFDAKKMAQNAEIAYKGITLVNVVTREFGLRGQLLLIMTYRSRR